MNGLAGESLKAKIQEFKSFFSEFNVSMHANEQEATATLNANAQKTLEERLKS
ncbi:hypothetical protein AB9R78_06155 [Helicobacter pylori]|uniref:hypothetical protein n=1 Tax=Helicobacter pylori TaxID=210 RepID=UPI0035717042